MAGFHRAFAGLASIAAVTPPNRLRSRAEESYANVALASGVFGIAICYFCSSTD
jgi:hypothetical protein